MTSIRCLLAALLLIAAPAFAQTSATTKQQTADNSSGLQAARAERTSIIRILANPDLFDGKRVSVIGFFHFEFEESAIYLHKADSDQAISQNGLWIRVPNGMDRAALANLNNHYVICEGQFSAKAHGHMDLYPGEISDIRAIHIWPSRTDFQRMQHPPTQP